MAFTHSPKIVQDGLIFYLDAANPRSYVSGSTTCNNLVSSNTGSLLNDVTFDSGSQGSWYFDGTDECINCGDMEMNGWTGFAVEAWYKAGEDTTTNRRIVSKDQKGTQGAWILWKAGDAQLWWQTHDGSWKYAKYLSYSEDLDWHHVVGTLLDGTSTLYLDGVSVASVGSVGALDDADNEEVVIGADSDINSPEDEWLGQIANVKIYNRGLSSSEVLQNYNALKNRFQ